MALIRLSDAIENLREELVLAKKQGKDKDLQFDISAIELELEVVIEKETGTGGKINYWIFQAGVDAKASKANTHKLKLTLQAIETNGKPLRVSQEQDERSE